MSNLRGCMGRVVWLAAALRSLRESRFLLAVRSLAGALSLTNCFLTRCLCFSVPDSQPQTGRASVLGRWQRLTSHRTASPQGQRAAGDSAPGGS